MSSILAPSTLKSYTRAWKVYKHVQENIFRESALLPISVASITTYITYLHSFKGIKASTIRTYLSGIAFLHKLKSMHDPTSNPVVRRLVDRLSSLNTSTDNRLPITRVLLEKLILALNSLVLGTYDTSLYIKQCFCWHGMPV